MPRKPTGQIRQRSNGTWEITVSRGTDPWTGKRLTKSRTFPPETTERKLMAEKNKMLRAAATTKARAPGGTAAEFLEEWFDTFSADWSPTTREDTRRRHLDRVILPALGRRQLASITTVDVDRLYAKLRSAGQAASTVRRTHNVLRAALNQAVVWGRLSVNPAVGAKPGRIIEVDRRAADPTEVALLIASAYAADPAFGTFLRLAAVTGARRGELCGLRWADIDTAKSTVTIARSIVMAEGAMHEKRPKSGKVRRVLIDEGTVEALKSHRQVKTDAALAEGVKLARTAYVFSYELDGSVAWRPDGVTARFMDLRDRLGLDGVRLHDLRHAAATVALSVIGADVRTVQRRLGHSSLEMTERYAHGDAGADRRLAVAMGELLGSSLDHIGKDKGQEQAEEEHEDDEPDAVAEHPHS